MSNFNLAGRTAIVTGSAKRNGRAIALSLADAGAAVVINARTSSDAANAVAAEITRRGGKAVVCMADVTDQTDVRRLVEKAVSTYGGLDILVNNAAIKPTLKFSEMTLEKWREVTAIMLDAPFLCALEAAPYLKRSAHGRVVNIGGLHGHSGAKDRVHLVTGKAGLVGLTKALAFDLAPTVTVNCVVPGRIVDESDSPEDLAAGAKRVPLETIPLAKYGSTSDVAAMVTFLCSDQANYLTGQSIHVNGGVYLG